MSPRLSDETIEEAERHVPSVTMPATLVAEQGIVTGDGATASALRYSEVALLGEGGMGKVHLCRDERIGREVAMKVILPELAEKPSTRTRFLREASVQGQLEHPSIVPVHDIGTTPDGSAFFTMKCVRGSTLEAVLSRSTLQEERFTTRRLLAAFTRVCLAVDFAHSRGVVHRDLKPSNVMLGGFGEVYLLDWGIAKLAAEPERVDPDLAPVSTNEKATPQTAAGSIIGTVAYMAPEQMTGAPASVRSDVFALGAILFEILAGVPLRDEESSLVTLLKGTYDARCSVRAPGRNVAPELEAICLRATAKDPTERYESAGALSAAIEEYLEGDRDVIRRREQAAEHVSRARIALSRPNDRSSTAMRELGSALALDPDNVEARSMVVEALTAVPKELPPEVRAELDERVQQSIVAGVRMWPVMLVTWILFAPVLYFAGIRELGTMGLGLGLLVLATVLGFVRARRRTGHWLEYGSFIASAIAMCTVGCAFGPLVIVPTLLATFATAVQLHPRARTRHIALGVFALALIGAVVVALLGAFPRIHGVTPAAILVTGTPGSELPLTLLVVLMNVVAMCTSALSVGGVRAQLTRAEELLLVHAWQVRRLMPADVTKKRASK